MVTRGNRSRLPVLALLSALVLTGSLLAFHMSAAADDARHCSRFARASAERAATDLGSGRPVVVIGDSYSVGLGLDQPAQAWPAQLDGRVHVAGFSGSGFSAGASGCGAVSFADRAAAAVASGGPDALVVVEGGLNDYDQPGADIAAGFERLMTELDGAEVVVVGPVTAPSRTARVPRVDRLLAQLSRAYGVPYLRTSHLDLPYLEDRLHLTAAGHRELGRFVAERLG